MEILPEHMQPNPYYVKRNFFVGKLNVQDGLIDITDPGYESDAWCTIFNKEILPGRYSCFIDVVNFPVLFKSEKKKKIKQDDERIMVLTIIHEDWIDKQKDKRWHLVSDNIGVDAGLCGFYNHKPDFKNETDWLEFCDGLKKLEKSFCTCDIKDYGITVSSGFGDGIYSLYKKTNYGKIFGLQLRFN